jgi:hypothetical protein
MIVATVSTHINVYLCPLMFTYAMPRSWPVIGTVQLIIIIVMADIIPFKPVYVGVFEHPFELLI